MKLQSTVANNMIILQYFREFMWKYKRFYPFIVQSCERGGCQKPRIVFLLFLLAQTAQAGVSGAKTRNMDSLRSKVRADYRTSINDIVIECSRVFFKHNKR